MAARHPQQVKEEAKRMLEEEGCTISETARRMGLTINVVSGWAKQGKWVVPEVVRQVRIQEQKIVVDPALDAVIKRMQGLTKTAREAEYDEAMHQLACSIPLILKQMSAQEIVSKADKVAKLVEVSRNILSKNDKQQSRTSFNLGVLLSSPPPIQQGRPVLELTDPERDEDE
jgi:hypothetical protein